MTTTKVVTRFAPSPTGYLHIGGARTALFCWLFARKMGGEFRLRIEDTDRERSTPEATQAILDGMEWLGLSHDGAIIYQSRNVNDHVAAAQKLLDSGHAYRCYCTAEELDEIRAASRIAGHALRSPWRDGDQAEPAGASYTIRFRVPDGETTITDQVQGDITWQNDQFDDLVLLRADGTPTYMLAVVVDDHNMDVTHVIRGDDHLINAGRQTQIYQGLGWDVPVWAHVPLIHGPDGKKLSKRHGAQAVTDFRDMGYAPQGLRNYLLKLGWSKDDQEIYSDDEAVAAFTLEDINSAPARLDFDKMDHINGEHFKVMDDDLLLEGLLPFLRDNHDDIKRARLKHAMFSLKARSKNYKDMATKAAYLLLDRPLEISGKAAKPLSRDGAKDHIKAVLPNFEAIDDWTSAPIHQILADYAEENEIGFGKIGQPLRAALTAGNPSPDLSDVIAFLGKEETIGRLQDALAASYNDI
ncbi:MAG: glutamate--tRNA ligase [Hellea sp.]|nr:glutamate--tRNA ligase [Hellea sp.]